MSILDNIKARRAALGRLEVPVPEWDCTLYFKPIGPKVVDAAMKRDPDSMVAQNISILIATAELEDGSMAFAYGDKAALMREAEVGVIGNIVTAVTEWSTEVGDSGNSEAST